MRACRAGMSTAAEGADMEVTALVHVTTCVVKIVADGATPLMHDRPALCIDAFSYGKDGRWGG